MILSIRSSLVNPLPISVVVHAVDCVPLCFHLWLILLLLQLLEDEYCHAGNEQDQQDGDGGAHSDCGLVEDEGDWSGGDGVHGGGDAGVFGTD